MISGTEKIGTSSDDSAAPPKIQTERQIAWLPTLDRLTLTENPFDRIDATQEYLRLLIETVAENRKVIEAEILDASSRGLRRQVEVWQVVSYNLESLDMHVKACCRTLNNLRRLRALILMDGVTEAVLPKKRSPVSCIEGLAGDD
jgi:hypothetical protein